MHLTSDGSISPNECSDCDLEFEGLDKGEQCNTFVVIPKAKKFNIIVKKEVEETKKTDEKLLKTFSLNKKSSKKSFKW